VKFIWAFALLALTLFPAWAQNRIVVTQAPSAIPSPALVGTEVAFNVLASDTGGSAVTYAWDFGDGTARTDFNVESKALHRYSKPGRYSVLIRMEAGGTRNTLSFFLLVHASMHSPRPTASSTIILDAGRKRVWTVNPDNNSVTCIDAEKLEKILETPVGEHPRTLAQSPSGLIWVTNEASATVSIIDPETGSVNQTLALPYGSKPFGMAFSPDGGNAYVTLQGTGKLLKLDPLTGKIISEVLVSGTPRGIAITGDSKRVLVTGFISPTDHGEISDVNAGTMNLQTKINLAEDKTPDAENAGRGIPNYISSIVIAPDGVQAWVLAKKDNTSRGLFREGRALDFQSTVRALIMRVDLASAKEDLIHRLDMDDSEMPSAIAFGPLGDPAFIAFQGSNKIAVWDPNANVRLLTIPSVGLAPQGLLVDSAAGYLFAQGFMSRTISVYDIRSLLIGQENSATEVKVIGTVAKENLSNQVLLGKKIFYNAADPRMSKDGYLSCASCHLDGGTDGRVWDFTDRGEGLRKTISLLGRSGMGSGPVHWSANFDEIQDFENDIRGPFGGTGFMLDADFHINDRDRTLGGKKAGLSLDLDALAAYVGSLSKVSASPYRNQDGSMTESGKAGEKIFNSPEVGCARCHIPPLYTDSRLPTTETHDSVTGDIFTGEFFKLHDVGTLKPSSGKRLNEILQGLDTPTLKGIWETPPYLHDGSAAQLDDVLTGFNSQDKHGHTSQLSATEREQLVAFLRQLDDGPAGTGLQPAKHNSGTFKFKIVTLAEENSYQLQLHWPESKGIPQLIFYNLSGKIVDKYSQAYLRQAQSLPGQLSLNWRGKNLKGQNLPAGLYSVMACLGQECQSQKIFPLF
jgi:YVTN family beta-propeller protein